MCANSCEAHIPDSHSDTFRYGLHKSVLKFDEHARFRDKNSSEKELFE